MKRIIAVLILIFCVYAIAGPNARPLCTIYEKELMKGDYLASQQLENGIHHVHFKCALKQHLRTYKKK